MDSGGGGVGGGGGSTVDDLDTPDSWEVADLDASMSKLKLALSLKKDSSSSSSRFPSSYSAPDLADDLDSSSGLRSGLGSGSGSSLSSTGVEKVVKTAVSEELINQVDQFLREAIQNPRERLSVLRMEQDVEKFIRDPTQQQLEFQHLPTSYLRLAAHRVAQHYSLQSMVLLDSNKPDGTDSRIIVIKTSECRLPLVRLADIPVSLPTEESGAVKVAIKQRAPRRSHGTSTENSHSSKTNNAKSVEERKEEYNRARARIFNSGSTSSRATVGKADIPPRMQDTIQHGFLGIPKREERSVSRGFDVNGGRGLIESSSGSSSSSSAAKVRVENESVCRNHSNSRVAIFRDREIDRKDPDYDRNYDRYLQRFDPGFGFNGGPYTVQPMYTHAVNYKSEFPQLGPAHRPQISAEHQTRQIPQHLPGGPGQWISTSNNAGIGYGHPEAMIPQFNPNRVGGHSTPAVYLHSQYPCHHPGMPYIHPHEHVHQPFSQSHQQQQPNGSFGLARPR